jgi:uncharacterized protein (AIM24 family)
MLAMSPTITLKGEIKFSVKKLISGGHMTMSHFIGPGELILAPHALGDVTAITLSGPEKWFVGKDTFLACTERVNKDYKMQTLSKAMFSGEGLFTYHISGHGVMWVASFGAIIRKEVSRRRVWRGGADCLLVERGGEVYRRQRSFGGVDRAVCHRAGGQRRRALQRGGRRGSCLQVYW